MSYWLFLDACGVIHFGSAPGPASCLGVVMAAAGKASPVEANSTGPLASFVVPLGNARIPDADREILRQAIMTYGHCSGQSTESSIKEFEAKVYGESMDALVVLLDADALSAARDCRRKGNGSMPSIAAYNLFVGAGAKVGLESQAARWRRQAAVAFPMFSNDIRAVPEVVEAIDGSSSLVTAIATSRGVAPSTVRALAGWPFGEAKRPTQLWLTTRVADVTPPNWLPRNPADWDKFRSFAKLLWGMGLVPFRPGDDPMQRAAEQACCVEASEASKRADAAQRRILQDIVRRNGRDWDAATAGDDLHLGNGANHLADTGLALCLEVVLPAAAAMGLESVGLIQGGMREGMKRLGSHLILAGRSPRQSLKISVAHLGRQTAATMPSTDNDLFSAWMPLGEDATAPNGLRIVNLSNPRALRDEGKEMGHCVGSYSWSCRDGTSRILSVRSQESPHWGTRLSTAEIRVDGSCRPRVFQHKSYKNSMPSTEARKALEWYLEMLEKSEVQGNLRELSALDARSSSTVMGDIGSVATVLDMAAGFDWRSAESREKTWTNWARLLDVRNMTVSEWLSSITDDIVVAAPECVFRTAVLSVLREHGSKEN